jgi:hypothetical protein
VGLGSVTVQYTAFAGSTAQLDARVWVVPGGPSTNENGGAQCQTSSPPAGCPLLISRGTYSAVPDELAAGWLPAVDQPRHLQA